MFPMIKTTSRYSNPSSSDSVTEPAAIPRAAQEEPRSVPVNVERVVIVSAPVIAELRAELYLYKSWQARDCVYTITLLMRIEDSMCIHQMLAAGSLGGNVFLIQMAAGHLQFTKTWRGQKSSTLSHRG